MLLWDGQGGEKPGHTVEHDHQALLHRRVLSDGWAGRACGERRVCRCESSRTIAGSSRVSILCLAAVATVSRVLTFTRANTRSCPLHTNRAWCSFCFQNCTRGRWEA
eukprot:1315368-Rhodomonas_salina.2